MSEQSLQTHEQQIPAFTEIEDADWGRDVNVEPTDTQAEASPSAEPAAQAVPEVDEAAQLARTRGWIPESEWHGPKDRWVDAQAFNERYETVLPVVQKENKKLSNELLTLRQKVAEFERKSGEFDKWQADQQASQRALRVDTLKMERKQAIEQGDTDALIRVDDELLKLNVAEATRPQPPARPAVDPVGMRIVTEFIAENEQFKDTKLQSVLSEQATLMRLTGSPLMGRELLEEASDRVKRMYPERFNGGGAAAMRRHPLGETGGAPTGGRTARGKTWNDLKPEVRTALEKFIQTTPGSTREGILKSAGPEYFRS